MIAYIAGLLEIGPKVVNPFGFDLIVSRKCIEFFIERVSLAQYHLENMHSKFEQIKSSLFNLHLLKIVHNDIKPENIMYSESTNKLLFIDFGLSEYINKPIGHKKSTKFIGTYKYSSPEMQKLLFYNETGLIDLYYNDAYSLNMALNKLFQIQKGP
jgi:serine/threonine protein kinase